MNAGSSVFLPKAPYGARFSFSVPQLAVPLATWAASNGIKSVYSLVADYSPGLDGEKAFQGEFKRAGGQIVGSVRVPLNNPDFGSYLQRIRKPKPDAVFRCSCRPAAEIWPVLFLKAFNEAGLAASGIKIIGTGETDEVSIDALGDAALGMVTASHYSAAHDSELNKAFVSRFSKPQPVESNASVLPPWPPTTRWRRSTSLPKPRAAAWMRKKTAELSKVSNSTVRAVRSRSMDRGTSCNHLHQARRTAKRAAGKYRVQQPSPACRPRSRVDCLDRRRVDMSFDTKPIPGTIAVFGANAHIGNPLAKFLRFQAPQVKLRLISSNPATTRNLEQQFPGCAGMSRRLFRSGVAGRCAPGCRGDLHRNANLPRRKGRDDQPGRFDKSGWPQRYTSSDRRARTGTDDRPGFLRNCVTSEAAPRRSISSRVMCLTRAGFRSVPQYRCLLYG